MTGLRFRVLLAFVFTTIALILSFVQIPLAKAQTSSVTNGTDPESQFSYYEIHNAAWKFISTAIQPNGSMIAIGLESGDIQLYTQTFQLLRTLSGHTGQVWQMAWAADGIRLASVSADGTAKVWDTTTGQLITSLTLQRDMPDAVAWSPDGTKLVTSSSTFIPDVSSGAPTTDDRVEVWETSNYTLLQSIPLNAIGSTISWNATGTEFVVPGALPGKINANLFWNVSSGQFIRSVSSVSTPVLTARWSPTGQYIAYGTTTDQADVVVVDLTTGQNVFDQHLELLPDDIANVSGLAWHSDGDWLAWSSIVDDDVNLVHVPTSTSVSLSGHQSPVLTVTWSLDGSRLVSASGDGTVRVWDTSVLPDVTGTLPCVIRQRRMVISAESDGETTG